MSSKKTQTKTQADDQPVEGEQPVEEKVEQPKTKAKTQPSKPLPGVAEQYPNLANLNYVQDAKARQDIIDEVDAIEDELLVMSKTSEHDLSVRYNGRGLIRVCPLKTQMSASINGGKIEKHTKAQILKAITSGVEQRKEEIEKARIEAEKIAQKEAEEKEKVEAEA